MTRIPIRTPKRVVVVASLLCALLAACLVGDAGAQSGPSQPRAGGRPRPKPEGEMRWALYVTMAPQWFDPGEVLATSTPSGSSTRCTTRS